jgi:acetyl-CoA acetyltransferase family protein
VHGVTREAADAYALLSQQRTEAARRAGRFADEIVPVPGRRKRAAVAVEQDEHPRYDTALASLAGLRPLFGTSLVTAGNASGIADGGAAVVVASAEWARARGISSLGRVVTWSFAGVEPRHMGLGPVPAIRGALRQAGLSLGQIDLFEVNEAFAAQYLAVAGELALPAERVNVNGGAIALGHPLGATGARLVLTLLLEMRRRSVRRGVASACIGGGQGTAIVVESMN